MEGRFPLHAYMLWAFRFHQSRSIACEQKDVLNADVARVFKWTWHFQLSFLRLFFSPADFIQHRNLMLTLPYPDGMSHRMNSIANVTSYLNENAMDEE